ncbi:MAG: cytochrome P450 [Dongiaceae bacterium]
MAISTAAPGTVQCPASARIARVPGWPIVGVLPQLRRDPLAFFAELGRIPGLAVEMQLGFRRALFPTSPAFIKHVMQDNARNYRKSDYVALLKPMLGDGIFLAEGDAWLAQRRTSAKGFQGFEYPRLVAGMNDAASDMVRRWDEEARRGRPVDLAEEMMRVTLDIILRALFSVTLDDRYETVYNALTHLLRDAERRVWAVVNIPFGVPTPRNRKVAAAQRVLDDFVESVVAQRRREGTQRGDLLDIFIAAYGERPSDGPAPNLLIDEVRSFILAGHETTANALSWVWWIGDKHRDAMRGMRDEIDAVMPSGEASIAALRRLEYVGQVFQETMRLYPPVWTMSRAAIGDDEFDGMKIAAGTNMILCPYAVHRNPALWPDPDTFRPERFAGRDERGSDRYAYFPFGGGPRRCLGEQFALWEARVILGQLLRRFDVEIEPGQEVLPEPMITLRPSGPIMARIRARN